MISDPEFSSGGRAYGPMEKDMFLKSSLAAAVAGVMAIGMLSAPANAWHRHWHTGVVISIGGGHHGHNHTHCHKKKIKKHGKWIKVKACHRHRHRHGHH